MTLRVRTVSLQGLRPIEVEVEVHLAKGIPVFNVVGLASKSVNESRDRIWSVFDILNIQKPMQRITVNLGPADLHKEGNHYDVPIALALLVAMDIIEPLDNYIAIGELALDGRILPTRGTLPIALYAESKQYNLICPDACGSEAIWGVENSRVIAAKNLMELIHHFKSKIILPEPTRNIIHIPPVNPVLIENIEGQSDAIWGATLAIAGCHNLLMSGHPGVGKTMIAQAMHALMPELSPTESVDTSMIYSVSDQRQNGICITPPFRSPHYTASLIGLIGGSAKAIPGEISLAHNGILFLDELPEFDRRAIESLRVVLESGEVTIIRAQYRITYPAKFILIAAMNPCPCGYLGNTSRQCSKAPRCAEQYTQKLSGPILDRFDLLIHLRHPKYTNTKKRYSTTSETQMQIARVRTIQLERFAGNIFNTNGRIPGGLVKKFITMSEDAEKTLDQFVNKLELSIRGRDRIIRLSRTIADFAEHNIVETVDILEALSYRQELLNK